MTVRRMLNKNELEKRVLELQRKAEQIGFKIIELEAEDQRTIRELEKCDIGLFNRKRKPNFVSPKNYRRSQNKLEEGQYGWLYGIKITGR